MCRFCCITISSRGNHWITLRFLRRADGSDAVGARVTLSAGGHKQIAEIRASGSYLSTNAPGKYTSDRDERRRGRH